MKQKELHVNAFLFHISRWITGEWQPCSRTCGGGVSRRIAYCVQEQEGGAFQRAEEVTCPAHKPPVTKPCNDVDCPYWIAGQWSPVCDTVHSIAIPENSYSETIVPVGNVVLKLRVRKAHFKCGNKLLD